MRTLTFYSDLNLRPAPGRWTLGVVPGSLYFFLLLPTLLHLHSHFKGKLGFQEYVSFFYVSQDER